MASFDRITVSTWACTHVWFEYEEVYLFLAFTIYIVTAKDPHCYANVDLSEVIP